MARADFGQIQSGQAINLNLNTVTTGATVYVANQSQISSATISISSITVSNFPTYFNVGVTSGTVSVSGSTMSVSGSTMTVSNFPSVQQVYWAMPQDVAVTSVLSPVDVSAATVPVIVTNQVAPSTHVALDFGLNTVGAVLITDGQGNDASVTGSGRLKVDGSGVTQPVSGTFWQATQPVSGTVSVSGPVQTSTHVIVDNTVPVSGAFFQATQPISGTVSVSGQVQTSTHVIVDNQVTVSTHMAIDNFPPSQPVTGTFFQATQPVSISGQVQTSTHVIVDNFVAPSTHTFVDNQIVESTHVSVDNFPASQAVTGAFFQATQPVSFPSPTVFLATTSVSISGSSNTVQVSNFPTTQAISGTVNDFVQNTATVTFNGVAQPVTVPLFPSVLVYAPLSISLSTTNVTGATVTATLPAVSGQFHYVQYIELEAYSTAARTGVATPIVCTSTDLMNNPSWTFATAAAIGTTDIHTYNTGFAPIKSAVANTATTVTCPATTGIIWRINVFYYTGA